MELLVQQGKVLYVGSSNFAGWHIARANEIAHHRNFLGLVSEQSLYNLNARTIELEVIPAVSEYGMGLIPWSPLAGGLLAGALKKVAEGRRGDEYMQGEIEQHREQAREVRGALRRARRACRPTSRWRGCWRTPSSRRRSSGRARASS